jgi:alpha-L-fucosidase
MRASIIKLLVVKCLFFATLSVSAQTDESLRAPASETLKPTQAERDVRLGWWRNARFGMFVHWGVYSYLGGTWQGVPKKGYAEHVQRAFKIPIPVYLKEVAWNFNPTNFNADEWVKLAKEAGMGYLVITAKHHDGFAMYDSKVSDYNIVKATPWHHDPMKDLSTACKKYGIKFGFYYSHAFDWGEKDGAGNDWDYDNPGGDLYLHTTKGNDNWWETYPEFITTINKYVDEKSIPQIQELIRNYDPDIMWFDTPHKIPKEENLRILAAVRKAKPTMVVNGRIGGPGDYSSTADCPAEFSPHDGDWEGVPTTNDSYGYNMNDHTHKPVAFFIRLLAKSAARGGNELMNIGPMGDGRIDPIDVNILKGIGKWWTINGETSIRGTTRTPLSVQAWGESTCKGNKLYLHVFYWPVGGKLVVGGLKTEVTRAYLLAEPGKALAVTRNGIDVKVDIPITAPDAIDAVVVLECSGEPKSDPVRLLSSAIASDTLRTFDAKISGKLKFGQGQKNSDWVMNWTQKEDSIIWPVRLTEKVSFDIMASYDAPQESKDIKIVEGDAGKEAAPAYKGDVGTYMVEIGNEKFIKKVSQGSRIIEELGRVALEPGSYQIRVSAQSITGQELFRLRSLILKPVLP